MMFKISRLPTKMATSSLDGNWVTIGVVVGKLPPKDSSKVRNWDSLLCISALSRLI